MDFQLISSKFTSLNPSGVLLLVTLGLVAIQLVSTWARLPGIPGPLPAKFTNLQRLLWVKTRKAHEIHLDMHKKYGGLVRMGPNMVSVGEPTDVPIIYPWDGTFRKSKAYTCFPAYVRSKAQMGMVGNRDEKLHKILRKPFASVYSSHNLEPIEPRIDASVDLLLNHLQQRSVNGGEVDLGFWLQIFVWDVLCTTMFSKRLGFLDYGEDVDGMLKGERQHFRRASPISQMPWFDYVWRRNPIVLYLKPAHRRTPVVDLALAEVQERQLQWQNNSKSKERHADLLDSFMAARHCDPETPERALLAWTIGGLGAGGETSVNSVTTLFYYLIAFPDTMQRLKAEIETARQEGKELKWKELRRLPYLDACIREALRIRPSIGLHLERVVPAGGAVISGKYMPEDTIVGVNAWVVNRNKEIFGHDVDAWRPERWLCEKPERVKMEQTIFSFGAGHRVCPGQNLSNLITTKLIVAFLTAFEGKLAEPERLPELDNALFVRQTGFTAKLKYLL